MVPPLEVASEVSAVAVVPPITRRPSAIDVKPVPPEPTPSAVPRLRTPLAEKLDCCEEPKLVAPRNQAVEVAVKSEVEAFVKFWVAVHQLELPRLRPQLETAALPLYEVPESELLVERLLRFAPRAMPLMVEFCSWLLPIVLVETKDVPS